MLLNVAIICILIDYTAQCYNLRYSLLIMIELLQLNANYECFLCRYSTQKCFSKFVDRLGIGARDNMFPVRYKLKSYIMFMRNPE
jgi:hypothetical protein